MGYTALLGGLALSPGGVAGLLLMGGVKGFV